MLRLIFFGTLKYAPMHRLQAFVVPAVDTGVDLGLCRQQHPADLHVAGVRREVQRGAAAAVPRGHGAGHRPQQVPHGAEAADRGRQDDVVAASAGGRPGRGFGGRATEAIWETQHSLQEDLSENEI